MKNSYWITFDCLKSDLHQHQKPYDYKNTSPSSRRNSNFDVRYHLNHLNISSSLNAEFITLDLNQLIGSKIQIRFLGTIQCIACKRKIKKTFQNGYCFPCVRSLAQADICMVRPEKCHYGKGTCRQPTWANDHCMIDHKVYLSISSNLKVGITRGYRIHQRWIDQGASYAIELGSVKSRYIAGLTEVVLKQKFKDKTNTKKMLCSTPKAEDLLKIRSQTLNSLLPSIEEYISSNPQNGCGNDHNNHPADNYFFQSDHHQVTINYPIIDYCEPDNLKLFDLKKHQSIEGILHGIKGQYLIFSSTSIDDNFRYALSARKYAGYHVQIIT